MSIISIIKDWKGIALATAIGVFSYILSGYTPAWFNSILIALLLGIILGNIFTWPATMQSGINFTSGKMLEWSVLFLASSINFSHIRALGATIFIGIAIIIGIVLLFTYFVAIKLKCPASAGWLIGFGTAICGSSAIAALSPIVAKEKESVGISMAVVNLLGTVGMIALPLVLTYFHATTQEMGLILGGTLHSVGNVAGAAYGISNEVGEAAITIKLARVALLSPGLILFNFLVNKKNNKNKLLVSHKTSFSLPWYLWSFIVITIIGSLIQFPELWVNFMETTGKVVLTIAMAAIGLKISFKHLLQAGRRGLLFGIMMFVVQIGLFFLLVKLIHLAI